VKIWRVHPIPSNKQINGLLVFKYFMNLIKVLWF